MNVNEEGVEDMTSKSRREFFILEGGVEKGPFNKIEFEQFVKSGNVGPDTFWWASGMKEWAPLDVYVADSEPMPENTTTSDGLMNKAICKMAGLTGLETFQGFSLSRFFGGVFRRHKDDEVEDFFASGTRLTTPSIENVNAAWPSPWIFTRIFAISLLLYFICLHGVAKYAGDGEQVSVAFGSYIFAYLLIGCFALPFCVVILFMELNVRRDVSFRAICRCLIWGGLSSIGFSLLIYNILDVGDGTSAWSACWAGPVEEAGKLAIAIKMAGRYRNGRILGGMVLGAAVGAGFASFETAGYVFAAFSEVEDGGLGVMELRSFFAPFAHVLWTAIEAGAYWLAMSFVTKSMRAGGVGNSWHLEVLKDARFWRVAAVPVVLHLLWNSPLMNDDVATFLTKHIVLGLVGWIMALLLVQKGLVQVREEQMSLRSVGGANYRS